jgi:kynurenine formamidase
MNPPSNTVNYGFISDLVMATTHCGTHIDAFAHVTKGDRDEWFGGHSANDELGDFGPRSGDASELPAIVARGVLLNIPAALRLDHCPPSHAISSRDLEAAASVGGVELRHGDVVLVRTGQMRYWPDQERMAAVEGAGVSIEGAEWLAAHRPLAVGSDTVQFECTPSGVDGSPQPVHIRLIQELGIPIMEWVNCEPLVHAAVTEFAFVCLPLPIHGATGSLINPIAIV